MFILGNENPNEMNIRTSTQINNRITKTLIAIARQPNICSRTNRIGREIYHQNSLYLALVQSTTGKFITADINTMTVANCLIRAFIRYHLAIINIPTTKDKAKNIYNQL
jgi:hypothetical protein